MLFDFYASLLIYFVLKCPTLTSLPVLGFQKKTFCFALIHPKTENIFILILIFVVISK